MRHLVQEQTAGGAAAAVDPRVRLLAALALLALVVSSPAAAFPCIVATVCLPAAVCCGMRPRTLLLRLLHPLFICVVILLLKSFGPATHGAAGHAGSLIAARIMGAVSVALLLGQVTSFTETMAALAWLRVPRTLVEVALFAWRSLFMLYDDAGIVYSAQKNRLGYCGMRRALRSFGAMAGMLVIKAFDSSHAMTVAMTQRGYDGRLPVMHATRPSLGQLAGLALFVLTATVAWRLQGMP